MSITIKYLSLLILALIAADTVCYSQTSDISAKIIKVENNLLQSAKIIFADSTVHHYNIYDRMRFYKVPSVSIAVINNGKLEWAKAYGIADKTEGKKANENTIYQAASISKSINAFCIMKLVQDGKLSLDKDVRQYLKSWTFPDNDLSKNKTITLKNLLSHTAGLSLHGFRGYSFDDKIPTINEILNGDLPANNEAVNPIYSPNTNMEYSGGGTLITRKILDDNISKNYSDLVKQTVLESLDMSRSSYIEPGKNGENNFATAYNKEETEIYGKYNIYPELAPDGLWTTATDLSKFVISLQQSLKNNSKGLLNDALAKKMITPVIKTSNAGLGLFISDISGEKYFMHSGANYGYRTILFGGISNGNGIVILTNSDNGETLYNEIINSIATVYGWKSFYHPETRKLVKLSNETSNKYVGEYYSDRPKIKITVVKKEDGLYMSIRGVDNLEKMLFLTNNKFYLSSSPTTFAEFIPSPDGKTDSLIVSENNNALFKAIKKEYAINKNLNVPAANWEFVQHPELMGWNTDKLEKLKIYIIDSTDITGYIIVNKGKIVFSYGDIQENSYIASCRKSVLSMLYGKYIKSGVISLDKSLRELGINDIGQLLPSEKEATIRNIISARSGVFHPASNGGDNAENAPKRGTVKHGEYWLYNNWDFNMAGYLFEKETHHNIYDEIENVLAKPLQMQDWNKSFQVKDGDESKSMYQSYPMWFSTRDMARIGLLMLNTGKWGESQIIDSDWISEMTRERTSYFEVNKNIPDFRNTDYSFGYGYMWWLWQNTNNEKLKNAYSALGTMGQSISVFPNADVVIVYKTKAAYERQTPTLSRFKVMTLAIEALEKNDALNKVF